MHIIQELLSNKMLIALGAAWLTSQVVKVIISLFAKEKVSLKKLIFSNGGMPSAHTASCTSITTSAGLIYGFDSFEFTIGALLTFVIMVDAAGVRYETGRHSRLLNKMKKGSVIEETEEKDFREQIGHTPLEIIVGACVGIVTAIILNLVF